MDNPGRDDKFDAAVDSGVKDRHYCMLQSMKQVSRDSYTAVLKCRGCGFSTRVKTASLVYANWQRLTQGENDA